jgi:hypothetical protein
LNLHDQIDDQSRDQQSPANIEISACGDQRSSHYTDAMLSAHGLPFSSSTILSTVSPKSAAVRLINDIA